LKEKINITAGLDVGSVYAKLVVRLPAGVAAPDGSSDLLRPLQVSAHENLWGCQVTVLGEPAAAASRLLAAAENLFPPIGLRLQTTGLHGQFLAKALQVPYINEFKAVAYGVAELVPEARTILEIGGDGSRYIAIDVRPDGVEVAILDYQRNGDCAAGTGSFIDQQAARLLLEVEEIGPLVELAENTASIAGRCSVFAKSDMVHAQQRGFSPAAIFKGLCEAVVRNFKGTVLRGKSLQPPLVFVGGVAANSGVVKAMSQVLGLGPGQLLVPKMHAYAAALGCAVLPGGATLAAGAASRLRTTENRHATDWARSQKLDTSGVHFVRTAATSSRAIPGTFGAFLGLDIGSVSTNLVLLDEEGGVIDEIYTRTEGRPVEVVQRELHGWKAKWGGRVRILGVGTTGSGRELIGELVGADAINDEITAHKTGANHVAAVIGGEIVDTIFEIGGQDSKFISIQNGVVVDFTMNEACAAGTGSFLEEQAAKMGISIVDEFAQLALSAAAPVQMGERCTVFMEKDVSAYLRQGVEKSDIAAGLAMAVVQNYLNRVVRGRKIGGVIYFQGGTAYNHAVAAAFAATLGKPIIVPPHCGVMGAIGAALLAKEKMRDALKTSQFHGFDLENVDFKVRHFSCKACSNHCDMQEITVNRERTYWGDKCSERYRKARKAGRTATLPDLIELYNRQLLSEIPGPDGLGLRIGVPRAMYYYDRFPFWRSYFAELGAEIVLSESTNRLTVARGRDYCIGEPCFPIIAGFGHVIDLLEKEVDFVLVPNAINAESTAPQESWYCPWGQTLPLMIRNTLHDTAWTKRLLTPVVRFRDGQSKVTDQLMGLAAQLGVAPARHRRAVTEAYAMQAQFRRLIADAGREALETLQQSGEQAIVLIGRPYNVYDQGLNLNVPGKLREQYGVNVVPMDFLPAEEIDVTPYHENMFWNYGRRILQAAALVGRTAGLHVIYITNFKCGPDSYIKHFVGDAINAPFLTLQFDEHSNDAGILTRCEAYLQSKNLLPSNISSIAAPVMSARG